MLAFEYEFGLWVSIVHANVLANFNKKIVTGSNRAW